MKTNVMRYAILLDIGQNDRVLYINRKVAPRGPIFGTGRFTTCSYRSGKAGN